MPKPKPASQCQSMSTIQDALEPEAVFLGLVNTSPGRSSLRMAITENHTQVLDTRHNRDALLLAIQRHTQKGSLWSSQNPLPLPLLGLMSAQIQHDP